MDEYIVKKDEGVIVKTYEDFGSADFLDEAKKLMPNDYYDLAWMITKYYRFYPNYPGVIKCVAKLAQNDTWDEERGKKVVDSKLALKKHLRVKRQASVMKSSLEKMIGYLDKIIQKHDEKAKAIMDDYERHFMGRKNV